ncbi:MAG: hypothetical protein LRY51_02625, partial [Geovibrio sp.]|nr:hypothetical protein [Geovibrio sp.]
MYSPCSKPASFSQFGARYILSVHDSSQKPASCSFFSLAACAVKLLAALVTFAFLAFAPVRTPAGTSMYLNHDSSLKP